jgi:hypothetical protein
MSDTDLAKRGQINSCRSLGFSENYLMSLTFLYTLCAPYARSQKSNDYLSKFNLLLDSGKSLELPKSGHAL